MPASCCVVGCVTRCGTKSKAEGISFFRIPVNVHQRRAWVTAIARKNWSPKSWERVCSKHFVSGWPIDDRHDVDYRPTVLMKGESCTKKTASVNITHRNQQAAKRAERRHLKEMFEVFEKAAEEKRQEEIAKQMSLSFHDYDKHMTDEENTNILSTEQQPIDSKQDHKEVQTDLSMEDISSLESRIDIIQHKLNKKMWGVHKIKDNDNMTKFYTGLPSFAIFMWLFNFLEPKANRMDFWGQKPQKRETGRTAMLLVDQFLFVLIRLKVGLFLEDLSDRFDVSVSTLSRVFNTWIPLLEKELENLNPFPSRDITARSLPASFQNFNNIRCSIDCTELFIEQASSSTPSSSTFSNNKDHTTVKFLVAIVPTGGICFVSQGWGGHVSDRCIIEKCGFLDHIRPDDLVMADKSFTIGDLLAKKGAFLQTPPFLSDKGRFKQHEIDLTKQIAPVLITVKRAIGRVKQFHILDPVISSSLNTRISSVFRVCCFLSNLGPPLVS